MSSSFLIFPCVVDRMSVSRLRIKHRFASQPITTEPCRIARGEHSSAGRVVGEVIAIEAMCAYLLVVRSAFVHSTHQSWQKLRYTMHSSNIGAIRGRPAQVLLVDPGLE